MKKKILVCLATATVLLAGFVSCGINDTVVVPGEKIDTTKLKVDNYKAADYVTLGQYEGLNVTLDGDYDTSDAAKEAYLEDILKSAGIFAKDEEATEVKSDSIVNVNYVGKLDGVAFEGGSADNVFIDVQNNCEASGRGGYIDGFTDGLAGAKVGETIDCDVTFPEDYGKSELAGKAVVFSFDINYVAKPIGAADLTDEIVSENFGYDTVDDLKKAVGDSLVSQTEAQKEKDLRTAVVDMVVKNSTIKEYPPKEYKARVNEYVQMFMDNYGVEDLETYLSESFDGTTMEEFYEEIETQVKSNMDQELVFLAIADENDIEVDEEGFNSYLSSMMTASGVTDKNDIYEQYAANAERGEAYLRRIYLCNKAIDLCVESANISK